jgi:hypothetical protein
MHRAFAIMLHNNINLKARELEESAWERASVQHRQTGELRR